MIDPQDLPLDEMSLGPKAQPSTPHPHLGTCVPAENIPAAFNAATARYKMRHPRLHVESIAVQEMSDDYADPTFVSLLDAVVA